MPPVRELLAVAAVWHDSNADLASQRFVLWASRLLEAKDAVAAYAAVLDAAVSDSSAAHNDGDGDPSGRAHSVGSENGSSGGSGSLAGGSAASQSENGSAAPGSRKQQRRRLPVSVLVHCEMDGPPVEMLASRRLLQASFKNSVLNVLLLAAMFCTYGLRMAAGCAAGVTATLS